MGNTTSKPQSVAEAKLQLRLAAAQIDYLSPIKAHPALYIGGAVAAGFLAKRLLKAPTLLSLLPVGVKLLRKML